MNIVVVISWYFCIEFLAMLHDQKKKVYPQTSSDERCDVFKSQDTPRNVRYAKYKKVLTFGLDTNNSIICSLIR